MLITASTMRPWVWGNIILTFTVRRVQKVFKGPALRGRRSGTGEIWGDLKEQTWNWGQVERGEGWGEDVRYLLLQGDCSLHATGLLSMVLSKYFLLLWVWRTSRWFGIFYLSKIKVYILHIFMVYSGVPNDITWQKNKNKNILVNYPIYIEREREME